MFDQPNQHREITLKGAYSKSIRERGPNASSNYRIKLLNQHKTDEPMALIAKLEERNEGLYFESEPLPEGAAEDRLLRNIRSSLINNFSEGWNYVWDKVEYDEARDLIILKEKQLFEISPVSIPSDLGTFAVRSAEELENLYDDTELFIKELPRSKQLEARQLFARHKSLIQVEPLEQRETALNTEDEPKEKRGLNWNYIAQNFKLD